MHQHAEHVDQPRGERLHSRPSTTTWSTTKPTARIYRKKSDAAARRVHEMIDDGIRAGALRDVNGTFAAQVVALTIDAVQSRSRPAQHRTLRG
jgi:hypothetical protein